MCLSVCTVVMSCDCLALLVFFFFKQKTAYEMRISDWSSDVCSSDLSETDLQSISPGLSVRSSQNSNQLNYAIRGQSLDPFSNTRPGVLPYVNEIQEIGRASCRERVCQYV